MVSRGWWIKLVSAKKEEVAKRLKEFAGRFKSMAELARAMGLANSQQLYVYLNGQSLPGFELLAKLRELGCDPNWLMAGESSAFLLPATVEAKVEYESAEMEEEVEKEVEKMVKLIKAARDSSQPMTSSSARELREALRKWMAKEYRIEYQKRKNRGKGRKS